MSALKKIMNDEIQKYQDRIYYLDMRSNGLRPRVEPANWIKTTKDYDHFSFELHHHGFLMHLKKVQLHLRLYHKKST